MSKVMTRLVPTVGQAEAWGIAQVPAGGRPLRVVVDVIQTPNNNGRAFVAFDATSLQSVDTSGIISDAYRIGDGCSRSFRVEEGQKLFIVGTGNVYCSIHVYASTEDDDGAGC